ncbi:hypothetical protein AC568_03840 [Mannheimia haemolytica]|nr:hypothetical protein AC568_03840 [Mannheimia haemolytica]
MPNNTARPALDNTVSQAFLNDLDQTLWTAADKLRKNLDAANYKHIVLGFIFLKYISDSFTDFQQAKNPAYHPRKRTLS